MNHQVMGWTVVNQVINVYDVLVIYKILEVNRAHDSHDHSWCETFSPCVVIWWGSKLHCLVMCVTIYVIYCVTNVCQDDCLKITSENLRICLFQFIWLYRGNSSVDQVENDNLHSGYKIFSMEISNGHVGN